MCKESENIEEICFDENNQPNLPLTTPFIQKRRDIGCSTLHSFNGSFELLHAYQNRLSTKNTVFLIVDLFTSKTYAYLIKKRALFKKKLEQFY